MKHLQSKKKKKKIKMIIINRMKKRKKNTKIKKSDNIKEEERTSIKEDSIAPPKPQPNIKESKDNILCEENEILEEEDQDKKEEEDQDKKEEKSITEKQDKTIVKSSSIDGLVSGERPKVDLSVKSHSCSKLDIINKQKDGDKQQKNEVLKSTNSLPNINKKLINDIFVSLLMSEQTEQKMVNSQTINLDKINIINIDGRGRGSRHKKYFSGFSAIKNTGYMSYDLKKTTVEDTNSYSKADIVTKGNNMHVFKDFLTIKSKKKKIYGSIEKMFDNNYDSDGDVSSSGGQVKFSVIATQSYSQKAKHSLKFKENDTIDVLMEKNDKYYGKCNGQEGWFPKSYVTILDNNDNTNDMD